MRLRSHLETLQSIWESTKDEEHFWIQVGHIAKIDYWAYLRLILQYQWMDPWWHGEEIVSFLQLTAGSDRLIMLPRGTGKSTVITVPIVPWAIAKNPLLITCTTNARGDKARAMNKSQALVIQNNRRYRAAFPYIVPSSKWGSTGYRLDFRALDVAVSRIDSSLVNYGVGGNMTGLHAGMMVHDDLINQTMAQYPSELAKARAFFIESQNCIDANGPVILNCTRWSFLDFYGEIERGEIQGHKGSFKVLKRGIYKPDGSIVWPHRVFIDLMGSRSESGFTEKQISNIRENLGPLFSALYLNESVAAAELAFDIEQIQVERETPFPLADISGVGVEAESQGQGLVSTLQMMKRDEFRAFRVDSLTSGRRKKEERIRSILSYLINEGRMYVLSHLSSGIFREELTMFPKGTDDVLDAIAHCASNAPKHENLSEPVRPYIAVDPAFTANTHSDWTAIAVGAWFNKGFWLLDISRFKTDRTDIICRGVFRMVDKWNNPRPRKRRKRGYRRALSLGDRKRSRGGATFPSGSFTVDRADLFGKEKV